MNAATDFHRSPSKSVDRRFSIDDPTRSVSFFAADAEHRAGHARSRLPAR